MRLVSFMCLAIPLAHSSVSNGDVKCAPARSPLSRFLAFSQSFLYSKSQPAAKEAPPAPKIFCGLKEAVQATPVSDGKSDTVQSNYGPIPVFGAAEKHFFRAVALDPNADTQVTKNGWLSGYDRGVTKFSTTLPPTASLRDRIIQYVGAENSDDPFPKDASVVGVTTNPSVAMDTAEGQMYERDYKYIRLDEIEIGAGARDPECASLKMLSAKLAFDEASARPRFPVDQEWDVDRAIPSKCVVSTFRFKTPKCHSWWDSQQFEKPHSD